MTASAARADMVSRSGITLPSAGSLVWLYALIGALGAMHLSMAFGRSINWDEFWFYSQVEVVARGEFIQPLQTIHTRFFAWWLPALPGTSIDHIIIARMFMLGCLAITATAIFAAARAFTERHTALLAVALYLGSGFVLQHGTAFRVDPIVAALLTTGFAVAARSRLNIAAILALGALIGLAGMVTIKFVLWAPAFAGLALYRWEEEGFDWRYPLRWVAAGLAALGAFGVIYILHASGAEDQAAGSAAGTLGSSANRMIGFLHSPHWDIAVKAAASALPLLIAAIILPWRVMKMPAAWTRRAAILAIWSPLLAPAFYYNSFPYFYAFILPPVAIACAFAIPFLTQRYGQAIIAAAIFLSAAAIWVVDARGVTAKQHALVNAVHEVFREPVNYFDCCGMIAPFAKQNHFRTQWGIDQYLSAGRPVMLETMLEKPVPLLLDNNREFTSALMDMRTGTYHPDDLAALKTTYLRYWGDIFIAGRDLGLGEEASWDVLVPGIYTAKGALTVNGTALADGQTIVLDRGTAAVINTGSQPARLIWGDNLSEPQGVSPGAYWTAF